MKKKQNKLKILPTIPPSDYKGSIGDWSVVLIERDLWNGTGRYKKRELLIERRVKMINN